MSSDTPRTNAEDELIAIIRYAEDGYALTCLRRHVEAEGSQLRAKVAELERLIGDPHAMHAHYLRIGNGWEVWTHERVRGMERRIAELERSYAERGVII